MSWVAKYMSVLLAGLTLLPNIGALPTSIASTNTPLSEAVTIDGIETIEIKPANTTLESRDPDAHRLDKRLGRNHGRDMSNAIDIWINCSGQEDNCDQDAAAILCLGVPRVLQRDSHGRSVHYSESGAARAPFRGPRNQIIQIGVDRPPTPNGEQPFDSAEEFPFESSYQGGTGAWLFPTQQRQQTSQGGKMSAAFRQYGVEDGYWYRIVDFLYCYGPYCNALRMNNPSICNQDLGKSRDWLRYARKRVSPKGQPYRFAPPGIGKVLSWIQQGGSKMGGRW